MPWDSSLLGGFTTGQPWLPMGEANLAVNVETSQRNSDSMLARYRRLFSLRRAERVLVSGQLTEVSASNGVLQFVRSDGKQRFRVMLNLGDQAQRLAVEQGTIVACTDLHRDGELVDRSLHLQPAEALIVRLVG